MKPRVLLAGLFHETHTFLPGRFGLNDFDRRQGDELLAARGDGSPLAGVVEFGLEAGWEFLPVVDLRAMPGPTVEDEVVDDFWRAMSAALRQLPQGGLDGVFLVLHGAMATPSYPDVEGEILHRLREQLPEDVPIGGVFDLHANFSPRMAQCSDGLVVYRHNPHTDAHESAVRAAELLDRILRHRLRPATVFQPTPLVWPPPGTGTADDPMRTLEAMARRAEEELPDVAAVNVMGGFAHADTHDTGVSFSAVTFGDPREAAARLREMAQWAVANRHLGNVLQPDIREVMPKVLAHREGPVLLVEPADNIGGGAPGDCTGVLHALVEYDVPRAGVILCDPDAVKSVQAWRIGQRGHLAIGSRSSPHHGGPAELEVELISTSDGRFTLEDPHSHLASIHGMNIEMGDCAVVRHRGVTVLLTSRRIPPMDLGQWRSQGIAPEEFFVIGVKAAVSHRRAYDPIAKAAYWVDTPGPCSSDLRRFPYKLLRRPVFPLDELPEDVLALR